MAIGVVVTVVIAENFTTFDPATPQNASTVQFMVSTAWMDLVNVFAMVPIAKTLSYVAVLVKVRLYLIMATTMFQMEMEKTDSCKMIDFFCGKKINSFSPTN